MSDPDGQTPPRSDIIYYAMRVAEFIDANTDTTEQTATVDRALIAQFVAETLYSPYTDTVIETALDQGLIVEVEDGQYALTDDGIDEMNEVSDEVSTAFTDTSNSTVK